MPEGLSVSEVGKEISEHHHRDGEESEASSGRVLMVIEAVLLAVVAVLAAYSGFAASKWATESSLALARAATAREFRQSNATRGARNQELRRLHIQRVVLGLCGRQHGGDDGGRATLPAQLLSGIQRLDCHRSVPQSVGTKGPDLYARVRPTRAGPDRSSRQGGRQPLHPRLYRWGGLRRLRPNHCLFGLSAFSGRNFWALPPPSRSHWPDHGGRRDPRYFDRPVADDAPPHPVIGAERVLLSLTRYGH